MSLVHLRQRETLKMSSMKIAAEMWLIMRIDMGKGLDSIKPRHQWLNGKLKIVLKRFNKRES